MEREQENIVTMGVRFVPAVEHSSEDQFNQGEEITKNIMQIEVKRYSKQSQD